MVGVEAGAEKEGAVCGREQTDLPRVHSLVRQRVSDEAGVTDFTFHFVLSLAR